MNSDTRRTEQRLIADEVSSDKIQLINVGIKDIGGSGGVPNHQSAANTLDSQNQLVNILVDLDQINDRTFGIDHKDQKRQASVEGEKS